jgi:EmrB/QacA subfamily drug resistance transporter
MSTSTERPTAWTAAHAPPHGRRWLALALLCTAQLMLILDVTVVNVALPDIGSALGLGRAALTWVLTAYTVTFGGLMLLGGRLADMWGARRVLLAGLATFTLASLVTGLAGGSGMLIGGRVAQGAGAALLSPAALSLVTATFTGTERHRALAIWAAIGGTGAALGVLLGGVLTAAASWRWIFIVNVPVGVVALASLPHLLLPDQPAPGRERVDVPGAALVTAATGSAMFGLVNAGSGWFTVRTVLPLAAAAALYAGFAAVERGTRAPLMDPRILARRPVAAGAFLMIIATGLLVGLFFLGSFYLQRHRGYGPLRTGLCFLPVAVAVIAGAQAAGRLLARIGSGWLATGALVTAGAGTAVAGRWLGPVILIIGMSLAALGLGAVFVTATTTALAPAGGPEAGVVSGVVNTFHELGGAVGVAALSGVAAASLTGAAGPGGFRAAFAVCAVAALAAAGIAAAVAPRGRTGVQ